MNLEEFKIEVKKYGWVLASSSISLSGYVYTFRKLFCKQSFDVYCNNSKDDSIIKDVSARTKHQEILLNPDKYSIKDLVKHLNKICSDDYIDFFEFYENEF
jgi:hypothetical protein